MTITNLVQDPHFTSVNEADFSREIKEIYCCDLLSIVMGRAPSDCAWVTVMGNINSVAVYVLADMSCIVLAEGMNIDDAALQKAKQQNVNIIKTSMPIFEAALLIKSLSA